ncbi:MULTISPECIES: immunity 42 family protein [Lonsdalea]|uniref:Uncharacterized protein n=2 Tax=Lonsdalea TaxID=1082702 RepID=A0ACD1JA88_9GAMM|nr:MULTISPECIES: immunity 42 family protein [Lonsdalea]RAT09654.1 hypothetical protein AU485_17315 [Lonsdalea quercina]RAT15676.1 hypothetical protein AU487_17310 [Lonsdalea populi]RAT18191.1 hypothetical protein AU488_17320 [Lonsdalea populi]RAT19545.1 hypothetical protein AU489_17110 [Lonsdalea populi]RAT30008.1 hypothetical protein AU492_17265 [Lonsdalea populi]
MIYGDPFVFALQFDVVEAWNIPGDTWKNGVFSLYVDGERLFNTIEVVELKTAFNFYSNAPLDELCVNDLIIDADSLYRNAENYFTGDGTELIDGLFDMTCTAMEDNACYIYFIKTTEGDRLVWSIDNGEHVIEKILPKNTIKEVINQLQQSAL